MKRFRPTLPALVILGALLGSTCGFLAPRFSLSLASVGSAYVMLLQSVVYPYLFCSLIHGLGRLEAETSRRFFAKAAPFFLLAWGVTFTVIAALSLALPEPRTVALDFTAPASTSAESFLRLLIPANVFVDLDSNTVPAVVIFALLFGFAIQAHPKKESLLSLLEVIKAASVTIWNWCVRLSPLAIFAMLASTIASVSGEELNQIALYVILFTLGTFVLAFWSIPGIVSAFLPIAPSRLVRDLRAALVIAAVTTLSVAALPLLSQTVRKLCQELGLEEQRRDELAETALAVAYPLGQLGNFFVYLFLLFSAGFYHQPISTSQTVLLPPLTLLSCVGSPSSTVNATSFLSDWLQFPEGATALYVQTMVVTRYGQVLVSVMAFALLTLLPIFAYYGRLQFRPRRLLAALLLPLISLTAMALALGQLDRHYAPQRLAPWMSLELSPALRADVRVSLLRQSDPQSSASKDATLARVRREGVLRVGYSATVIPFCYWNQRKELVGYDVAMAYQLARDLGVKLKLVPFAWDDLIEDLSRHRFDVAMAGVYVTPDRLRQLGVTVAYFHSPWAFLVPSEQASRMGTIDDFRQGPFTVFQDKVMLDFLSEEFPGVQPTVVPDYASLVGKTAAAPAPWTLLQASAFAAANPGFTAVRPTGLGDPVLFAYMTPKDSELLTFLDYWMQQKDLEGFSQQERDYWLEGKPRENGDSL